MTAPVITTTAAPIVTVAPALNVGEIQLSADRRSTKEKPLSDAQRIRRAVLPANHWPDFHGMLGDAKSQALTDLLRESLRAIGSARLKETLELDDSVKSIPLADYTIAALLVWNEETAAARGAITFTKEQILDWFPTSATATALRERFKGDSKGSAKFDLIAKRFETLAAKNHGIKKPEDADKLVALLAPEELAEGAPNVALITEIMSRCAAIATSLRKRDDDATVSMDDI